MVPLVYSSVSMVVYLTNRGVVISGNGQIENVVERMVEVSLF